MSALERLVGLRRSIVLALVARMLFVGIVVALVSVWIGRVAGLGAWALRLALPAIAGAAAFRANALRNARSLPRIALWVEERTPSLRYALVSVAEGIQSPALEQQALGTPWWNDARRTLLRSLVVPGSMALVLSAFTVRFAFFAPVQFRDTDDSAPRGAMEAARVTDVLAVVHAAVTPPAYANKPATAVDDPTSIEALVGSSIAVTGNGEASRLKATADSAPRSIAQRGAGWSLSLTMPARPAIVRLHARGSRDRLIVLAPIVDAAPVVTLLLPLRDTILRRATGVLGLRAQLRDDIGLHDADFELVVSSGSGENFTFRTAVIGRRQLSGSAESLLEGRVSLDSLKLEPGDILQLRAVARDANNVTGPGVGSSETRSIRIARAGEYDSVAVDAAPPPEAEGNVLSQRMLLDLTLALVKRQSSLTRAVLVSESQHIADDQRKLRKRVGDVVFQRMGGEPLAEEGSDAPEPGKLTPEEVLKRADAVTSTAGNVMDVEGDETPILAINKPLLEAFNAMWDAGRALEVGEPAKAIAPMRVALAAIEKARTAERIYLRGRPGAVVVDVAKARLQGKDKGVSSTSAPRVPLDPVVRRRSGTFERVSALMARDPDAAADSLLLMRVDALGDAPRLAAALDDAARALRKRDSAAIPLAWMRVRRALGGATEQRAGITPWLGAP